MELLQLCTLLLCMQLGRHVVLARRITSGVFKKKIDGTLKSVRDETEAVSLIDCSIQCMTVLEDTCYSFDFDKQTGVCKMSELPAVSSNGSQTSSSSVYDDVDDCQEDNGGCGQALCVNTGGGFSCSCNGLAPVDMVELVQTYNSDVTASISSQHYGNYDYGPHVAIDGYRDASWQSLAISEREHSPWIQLDLSTAHCIDSVKIYDQALNYESDDNVANVKVTIGEAESDLTEDDDKYLCAYKEGQPPGDEFTMTCVQRIYGRFVRVTAVGIDTELRLHEIEVFGW